MADIDEDEVELEVEEVAKTEVIQVVNGATEVITTTETTHRMEMTNGVVVEDTTEVKQNQQIIEIEGEGALKAEADEPPDDIKTVEDDFQKTEDQITEIEEDRLDLHKSMDGINEIPADEAVAEEAVAEETVEVTETAQVEEIAEVKEVEAVQESEPDKETELEVVPESAEEIKSAVEAEAEMVAGEAQPLVEEPEIVIDEELVQESKVAAAAESSPPTEETQAEEPSEPLVVADEKELEPEGTVEVAIEPETGLEPQTEPTPSPPVEVAEPVTRNPTPPPPREPTPPPPPREPTPPPREPTPPPREPTPPPPKEPTPPPPKEPTPPPPKKPTPPPPKEPTPSLPKEPTPSPPREPTPPPPKEATPPPPIESTPPPPVETTVIEESVPSPVAKEEISSVPETKQVTQNEDSPVARVEHRPSPEPTPIPRRRSPSPVSRVTSRPPRRSPPPDPSTASSGGSTYSSRTSYAAPVSHHSLVDRPAKYQRYTNVTKEPYEYKPPANPWVRNFDDAVSISTFARPSYMQTERFLRESRARSAIRTQERERSRSRSRFEPRAHSTAYRPRDYSVPVGLLESRPSSVAQSRQSSFSSIIDYCDRTNRTLSRAGSATRVYESSFSRAPSTSDILGGASHALSGLYDRPYSRASRRDAYEPKFLSFNYKPTNYQSLQLTSSANEVPSASRYRFDNRWSYSRPSTSASTASKLDDELEFASPRHQFLLLSTVEEIEKTFLHEREERQKMEREKHDLDRESQRLKQRNLQNRAYSLERYNTYDTGSSWSRSYQTTPRIESRYSYSTSAVPYTSSYRSTYQYRSKPLQSTSYNVSYVPGKTRYTSYSTTYRTRRY